MGRDLAEAYPAARAVFDEVDEALGETLSGADLGGRCRTTLTLTANAQPALMATSLAAMRALEAEGVACAGSFVAGHSLGEYSALAAAGRWRADTARLLRLRGRGDAGGGAGGQGAMAAILGLDFETGARVAGEAARARSVQAANDNDPGQVVVSGHKAAVERAVELAKERGAKRAMLLPVSAPFHCDADGPGRRGDGARLAGCRRSPRPRCRWCRT